MILPVAFHLKMFGRDMSKRNMVWDVSLIVVSIVLGVTGFVWEFLPSSFTSV